MKHSSPVFALILCTHVAANAQSLPPPSRTVYKCEDNGKTYYSDSPCLGAQRIDVEPTRGLNKTSGRERVGHDVQRERNREAFAEMTRPLTGMDARQLDHAGRRMRLGPEQQRACRQLDSLLPAAEHAERSAANAAQRHSAQLEVFKLRKAYRDGGCE